MKKALLILSASVAIAGALVAIAGFLIARIVFDLTPGDLWYEAKRRIERESEKHEDNPSRHSHQELGAWQLELGQGGEFTIKHEQTTVVRAKYAFWSEDWKWANPRIDHGPRSPAGESMLNGEVPDLGISISGQITNPIGHQLKIEWDLEVAEPLDNVVGGGLEFKLDLSNPSLEGARIFPNLDPDRLGWYWEPAENERLLVTFDPPLAQLGLEQGQRDKIRAMLVADQLRPGSHTVTMTITLPLGAEVYDLKEKYGYSDTASWFRESLRADSSPIDLSFLNHKPAGKHGFVESVGNNFIFEDGTPIRFWGANLAASAIFVEKHHIEQQAKRIAQLGYNLIRIHHQDSTGWVSRTIIDQSRDDSRHFDAEFFDRLDYWIKCLRDQGIYVWLDLHVGRLFKEGDEIGAGFAEMVANRAKDPDKGAGGRGYSYFNDQIEHLMQAANEVYLSHVNPYTGLAYKDDPSIMGLLITNENDITHHFGNLMLPDKQNPYHNQIFDEAVRTFSERKDLPYSQTSRTWEPGPSKLFLADREWQWNRRMIDHLRSVGAKAPIATTQLWGSMPASGIPPLTAGDIIDLHSYGLGESLGSNPRYVDNYVSYIATGALSGYPITITEWNVPYPAADRFTAPLYMASIAALQNWAAPMIYNYSQRPFDTDQRSLTWSTFLDPALTGMMPAAALMFREQHVRPANDSYFVSLDRDELYYRNTSTRNSKSLRTLAERSRVLIGLPDVEELDWDEESVVPTRAKVVDDLDTDFIPPGQYYVESDTGEILRNWKIGYQQIDTDGTQAVHGWIGRRKHELRHATFEILTPKAAVAVSSLDSQAIPQSSRILITAIGRAVVRKESGKEHIMSEPIVGKLRVSAASGMRLFPLDERGNHLDPIEPAYRDGAYEILLPVPGGTHWYLLK
jgi:hypothetical protein